jgi:hypothetical protein
VTGAVRSPASPRVLIHAKSSRLRRPEDRLAFSERDRDPRRHRGLRSGGRGLDVLRVPAGGREASARRRLDEHQPRAGAGARSRSGDSLRCPGPSRRGEASRAWPRDSRRGKPVSRGHLPGDRDHRPGRWERGGGEEALGGNALRATSHRGRGAGAAAAENPGRGRPAPGDAAGRLRRDPGKLSHDSRRDRGRESDSSGSASQLHSHQCGGPRRLRSRSRVRHGAGAELPGGGCRDERARRGSQRGLANRRSAGGEGRKGLLADRQEAGAPLPARGLDRAGDGPAPPPGRDA